MGDNCIVECSSLVGGIYFADSGSSFNFLLVKVHNLPESVLAQFRSLFDFLLVKPSQQWPVWLLNAVAVALILVTRVADLSQGRVDMIFYGEAPKQSKNTKLNSGRRRKNRYLTLLFGSCSWHFAKCFLLLKVYLQYNACIPVAPMHGRSSAVCLLPIL